MEPTNNDPEFRTWDPWSQDTSPDRHKYNPWRAPGMAPVIDPCGIASGGVSGGNDYDAVPTGYSTGDKGTEKLPETDATLWQAGATATVGWALSAQHSGGYSYRLCPKDSALTEACFQSNVLTFATTNSSIHWNDDSAPDREIITRTYIAPDGSNWRTNPIPQCQWSKSGGGIHGAPNDQCAMGTFFETSFGDSEASNGYLYPANTGKNKFSIMDEVNVPNTPGKYLLSWRWDCEEANQVWNSCADIEIVAGSVPAPTPRTHDADNTCSGFGPGMSCSSDEACMTRDESGDCIECCPGCWWMFHKGQNQCRGANRGDVAV
jgi:hypothetical protein